MSESKIVSCDLMDEDQKQMINLSLDLARQNPDQPKVTFGFGHEVIEECVICSEVLLEEKRYITECLHMFCIECILGWIDTQIQYKYDISCPICRCVLNSQDIKTTFKHFKSNLSNKITVAPTVIRPLQLSGFHYEDFLMLSGVDEVADKFIILDMILSSGWVINIGKYLKVRSLLDSNIRVLFTQGLFIDQQYKDMPYRSKPLQVIFKWYNKKIHIDNNDPSVYHHSDKIYIEVTDDDKKIFTALDLAIQEGKIVYNKISNHLHRIDKNNKIISNGQSNESPPAHLSGGGGNLRSKDRYCFPIKVTRGECNVYHGESTFEIFSQGKIYFRGDVAFSVTFEMFSKGIKADAIEINSHTNLFNYKQPKS